MTTQWKCHEDDYGVYIKKGDVCIAKTGCIKQGRLIAAAPDMLEALELVAKTIANPNGTDSHFEDKLFAAINKAKGVK